MNGSVPIQQAFATAVRHHQAGQLREAEGLYRQIVAAQPNHADALHMLGIALHQLGCGAESVHMLRHAIAMNPRAADYHANLGSVLAALRQPEAAVSEFCAALALKTDLPETHNSLGKLLSARGAFDEAIAEFRQAIAQKPALAEAHNNLGDALKETGQLVEALSSYRRAMTLSPDVRWASNLVHSLHLHPDVTPRQLHEAQQRWSQSHAEALVAQVPVHDNDATPDRRLRIGYVSANFRQDPQSSFILPLLAAHDRNRFEVFCYSNNGEPDAAATQMRSLVEGWHEIAAMTDQQASEIVRGDRIDILVDLDMHSPGNRLLLFARKPSPVQVSGLAYPGTAGILTIDYRFTDPHVEPDRMEQAFYSERSLWLPETMFCHAPPSQDSPVTDLPAARNGFITFGHIGAFSGVTARTLELWADVLCRVAGSRLLLLAPRGACRDRVREFFANSGIGGERMEFVDGHPGRANPDFYRRLDVCIDTFPWNGCTSTLDALWMGVPVITLAGHTGVSRIGAGLLGAVGLGNFVARSAADFAEIAARLANDVSTLAGLRSTLRQRLRSSPLMDTAGFARGLESAYRQMWTTWCGERARPVPVVACSF